MCACEFPFVYSFQHLRQIGYDARRTIEDENELFVSVQEKSKTFANEPIYLLIYFRLVSSFLLAVVPFLLLFWSFCLIFIVGSFVCSFDERKDGEFSFALHFYNPFNSYVSIFFFMAKSYSFFRPLHANVRERMPKSAVYVWKSERESHKQLDVVATAFQFRHTHTMCKYCLDIVVNAYVERKCGDFCPC